MSNSQINNIFRNALISFHQQTIGKINNRIKFMADDILTNVIKFSPSPQNDSPYSTGAFLQNTKVTITVASVSFKKGSQTVTQFLLGQNAHGQQGGKLVSSYSGIFSGGSQSSASNRLIKSIVITNDTANPKNGYKYFWNVQKTGWNIAQDSSRPPSFLDNNVHYTAKTPPYQPFKLAYQAVKSSWNSR